MSELNDHQKSAILEKLAVRNKPVISRNLFFTQNNNNFFTNVSTRFSIAANWEHLKQVATYQDYVQDKGKVKIIAICKMN